MKRLVIRPKYCLHLFAAGRRYFVEGFGSVCYLTAMQRSLFKRLYRLRWRPVAFSPGIVRSTKSGGFSGGTFATLTLAAFWLAFATPAEAQQQVLKGHVPPMAKRLTPLRRLEGGARLDLAIGLPLRNREQLTNLLHDLYQPGSANFRHYLTPEEFASSFGPSQEDYQAVIDFAKSHGLTVKNTHPNRTLLDVSGSVADIEKAFHVHMHVFQHPKEARTFFAPDAEPSPDLATPLLMISGLDNYVKPRPRIHPWRAAAQPMVRPFGGGGSGGGGSNTGPFEGSDFRKAYAAGLSQDGTGQTVGIFELFGFSQQDIMDYEDDALISPYVTVTPVLVDGATGDDVNVDYTNPGYIAYGLEAASDIEMAISMAPGLDSVRVYIGPTPVDQAPLATGFVQDATTTAQINDVLNSMATDPIILAQQLSCSYGMDINLSTVQIFQQFAAQGQSFFQASGDVGAYSGAIDEPADDPYLTVVGGTSLTTTTNGTWASEIVWLTPADALGDPFVASGGGVSLTYPIPSWQQGISMTANQGSTTMRNVPDVAMVANNVTILWGNDAAGTSLALQEGGTSLAAPLWAGFMALVNEQAAASHLPPVGFANPALYAIGKSSSYPACFHDITSGNNFNSNSPSKYSAKPGYDLCTGWGTMIGANLMQALLNPPFENLVITQPFGFTSFGPSGGPFTVTSQTITLANFGTNTLIWSLANPSRWLTVSSNSGSLDPFAVTSVTVSLNSAASNIMIANVSGNVVFSDLTDGTAQNLQFNLYVGNGGFETGDFTDWVFTGDPTLTFALAGDDVDVGGTAALPGAADELFVHSGLYGAYLGEFLQTNSDGVVISPPVGSLSQTVATTAGQKYLVSFWLTSVLLPGSGDTNGFVANWNGLTLYSQTNTDFGWTNLQFIVPATAASTTLEFFFNNVPAAYGLDDVTVQPVPGPVFQSVALAGGNITLTWSSVANSSYQIQSANNLANPSWANVGAPVIASGNVMSASEPIGGAVQQFYRVVLLLGP